MFTGGDIAIFLFILILGISEIINRLFRRIDNERL